MLGPHGRGLADEAGLEDEVDFIVGTFSKSVGAIGGFGAGNQPLFDMIRYATRPYMFTASPSPASAATSLAAIRKLAAEPERRERLRRNSAQLHAGFKSLGLDLACSVVSPVIAVKCADEISTIAMWNALLEAGVYVNIAVPPAHARESLPAALLGLRRAHEGRDRDDHRAFRRGRRQEARGLGRRLDLEPV